MDCFESNSRKGLEKAKMSDNGSAISRRSTRMYKEENAYNEAGNSSTMLESRTPSVDENDQPQRDQSASTSFQTRLAPRVDLGLDLCGIFPTTADDMGKEVAKRLQQAAHISTRQASVDGKPLNFGVVLHNSIYRSSLPLEADFQYLETLGLKTILSLVQKDFSPEFRSFMLRNSIVHRVIDMPGTKKVAISEDLIASIMKIALNQENYPILIHCNHGKHRTGCAVAVIRHVTGWGIDEIVEEYRGYALPKVRECDVEYITNYQVSSLEGLFLRKQRLRHKKPTLTNEKMAKMLVITVLALTIWFATFLYW